MKKFLIMPLVVILVLASASSALAVVFLYKATVPATANVVTGTPGLELYEDSAATTPLTSLDFGDVAKGGITSKTIYIKNVGDATVDLRGYTDLSYDVGWCSGYAYELEAGKVATLQLRLQVRDTATLGSISFTVTVEGTSTTLLKGELFPAPAPVPPVPKE